MDYSNASRKYSLSSRPRKHVGLRLPPTGYYLWKNPETNFFHVRRLISKYKKVVKDGVEGYVTAPTEEWRFETIAEISPSGINFHGSGDRLAARSNALLRIFGLRVTKLRTITKSGHNWRYGKQEVEAERIRINAFGDLEIVEPSRVRVRDQEKMKPILDEIKRVRNLIRVRYKMGVLEGLRLPEFNTVPLSLNDDSNFWEYYSNPEKVLALLKSIDGKNLQSFIPLMWLSLRHRGWGEFHWKQQPDWPKVFDSYINRAKEALRKHAGAVRYE